MKSTKMLFVLLLMSATLASGLAFARGPVRGHVGVYFGGPLYWPGPYYASPYYAYPPYYPAYYPPAVVAPAAPPAYVEQGSAQAAPAPQGNNWWYYCADAKAYYPYVRECPAGWQRVAPQPSS